MYCLKCGQNIPNEANFCSNCGNRIINKGSAITYQDKDVIIKKDNNLLGFIDRFSGQFIIPPVYSIVGNFKKGLAFVALAGEWGCIDMSGNNVIECKYYSIQWVLDWDLIVAIDEYRGSDSSRKNVHYSFFDVEGKLIFELDCHNITFRWTKGGIVFYIDANKKKKGYFIDKKGENVFKKEYDYIDCIDFNNKTKGIACHKYNYGQKGYTIDYISFDLKITETEYIETSYIIT